MLDLKRREKIYIEVVLCECICMHTKFKKLFSTTNKFPLPLICYIHILVNMATKDLFLFKTAYTTSHIKFSVTLDMPHFDIS